MSLYSMYREESHGKSLASLVSIRRISSKLRMSDTLSNLEVSGTLQVKLIFNYNLTFFIFILVHSMYRHTSILYKAYDKILLILSENMHKCDLNLLHTSEFKKVYVFIHNSVY